MSSPNIRGSWLASLPTAIVIWVLFILMYFHLVSSYPSLTYHLNLLALIPGILFSMRQGLTGSFISLGATASIVFGSRLTETSDALLYISGTGLAFCAVGVMSEIQLRLNKQLVQSHQQLQQLNDELNQAITTSRALAHDAFTEQEQLRKSLSQDLHDDLGQKITVLKTQAYLAESESSEKQQLVYREIQQAANRLYQYLKRHLSWLRPASLDELGLIDTLKYGELSKAARQAGAMLLVTGDVPEEALTNQQRIAIYRLCQLLVGIWISNSIKSIQINFDTDNSGSLKQVSLSFSPSSYTSDMSVSDLQLAELKQYVLAADMTLRHLSQGYVVLLR